MPPEANNPFSVSIDSFAQDTTVNVVSGYAALHCATQLWSRPSEKAVSATRNVFIATGNVTPFYPNPFATTLGSGKAALVHLIEIASQQSDARKNQYAHLTLILCD